MSENLISLFPKSHLDALIAHAKAFDSNVRADADGGLPELLACFPQGIGNNTFHRDAAESIFVARQLEHIRQGVIDASFPALKAQMLIPFDTSVDEGAEQYTVTYSEQAGEVRVSKDMTGIIPNVDVKVGQTTYPIFSLLQAYGYSLQEARAAMKEHKPLAADRAMRCREQIQRKIDTIALMGESTAGLKGLFTLANTATYATPADGTGAVKQWTMKTPTLILRDWNSAVSQVVVDTKEIEVPDTSVLPTSRFELVSTTRVGDGTSDTILTYFKRNNPHITEVHSSEKLELSAGNWTGKRMVNYQKNPLKVAMILPVPFEQLTPDVTSTTTNTICHARTAGAVAHRPKSVIYADDI